MKAYLEHVNNRGGINGRRVRVVVLDDQAQPSRAAANAKQLLAQERALALINSSLSSTYAPMVAESKRANVPLYFAGAVCPTETYPPADPLQFCSTAFGARLDSQAALAFIRKNAKESVRLGLAAMAIPISRGEIDYAEGLSKTLGMTPVEKQISPPPAPDYTPFATRLKDANPTWMWSWAPWVAQVRTFEAMRRLGWQGSYLTWAHLNAEEELERIKDPSFYVIGTNAMMQDDLAIHAEIRAIAAKANLQWPVSYLTEGFVAGLVRGSDPTLRDTYVVMTAHFDHDGVGAPDESGDSIYNGADDDASGTAVVLEANGASLGFIPVRIFFPFAVLKPSTEIFAVLLEFHHLFPVQPMLNMTIIIHDPGAVPLACRINFFARRSSKHVITTACLLLFPKISFPAGIIQQLKLGPGFIIILVFRIFHDMVQDSAVPAG